MRLVAIVPARRGSKGLPGKNVRPLAGVPLWLRAVRQALDAGAGEVVVTTDDPGILGAGVPDGVTLLERPAVLAADDTPMAPVVTDALTRAVTGDARVVLLQPTSPLRVLADISATVARHGRGDVDLALTVSAADRGVLKWGRLESDRFRPLADPAFCFSNRQALPPVVRPNGAVYVFSAGWFLSNGGFATLRIGAVEMPPERSADIDGEEDFARAEAALHSGGT